MHGTRDRCGNIPGLKLCKLADDRRIHAMKEPLERFQCFEVERVSWVFVGECAEMDPIA